jgi:hypothetical protein
MRREPSDDFYDYFSDDTMPYIDKISSLTIVVERMIII